MTSVTPHCRELSPLQVLCFTTMPASVSRIGSIKGICKPPILGTSESHIRWNGSVSMEGLAAGTYTLRVTLEGGKTFSDMVVKE